MTCCGHSGSPFVQTLFLGASITQFSSSVDWNGTGGSLYVEVVEDDCSGHSRVYVDGLGNIKSTTDADKFMPPGVGAPVYFYYGGFEFGGLLDNWVEENSVSYPKTYQINVVSPRQILDGAQVILNGYDGPSYGVPNLVNVHGYLNTMCASCGEGEFSLLYPPQGMSSAITYTPAAGWCYAGNVGWSWNSIYNALLLMLNGAGGVYGGLLSYRGYTYIVDISQLPLLNEQIRVNYESMSLSDLIDYICGLAGVDYFYELVPVASGNGGCYQSGQLGPGPHIIRVVVGNSPYQSYEQSAADIDQAICTSIDTRLSYGVIASQIGAANCINKYSRGVQSRNDYMAAFIVGDNRRDVWQIDYSGACDGNDTIWPYWGRDADGTVILGTGCDFGDCDVDHTHKFTVDISHLGVGIQTWTVTLPELRAAMVSESSWRAWLLAKEPDKINQLDTTAEYKVPDEGFLQAVLQAAQAGNGGVKPNDWFNLGFDAMQKKINDNAWKKGSIIYNFIRKYATEYYGRKFMVKLPFECISTDPDEPYSYANSWVPTDGGWTEWPVLGFATDSAQVSFFRLDDGRLQCFVRILSDGQHPLQIDNLSKDDMYPISEYEILLKGTVEEIVWVKSGDARAVIQLSGPVCQENDDGALPEWLLMFQLAGQGDVDDFKDLMFVPGNDKLHLGMANHFLMPISAAVPLQSQRLCYGPWFASSIHDFNFFGTGAVFSGDDFGATYYERDSSLSPWEFGSTFLMNYCGYAIAASRVGDKYVSEKGSITFPGAPTGSLGSEIASGGPIISNIDVQIGRGTGSIVTTYRMKTYVPDWGRLKEAYVDMIRRAGQTASKVYNIYRKMAVKRYHDISIRQVEQQLLAWKVAHQFEPHSSLDMFSGIAFQDPSDSSHARTSVSVTEMRKESLMLRPDDDDKYTQRALVEAIGIFRPFSTKISSGDNEYFPRFEDHTHTAGCPTGTSEYMCNNTDFCSKEQVPPIFCAEHHLPIVVGTLSPFLKTNRSVINGGDGICLNDDTNGVGHDIEYIVRDGVYPTHLNIRQPSDNYSESHWYRAIALRGPLIIAGWGFDIDNKPVPNASSDYPNNPQMKFDSDWLRKPHTWKCGPVDLRWDYRRKVWTAPTPHKIVRMELQDDLCPESCATAILYDDQIQYDRDGNPLTQESGCAGKSGYKVKVWSNAMRGVPKGWRIMAMFDTTYDRYYMINHDDFPLVEAVLSDDLQCDGTVEATITQVAGGNSDYDPCGSLSGKTILLRNPLHQPICSGSTVIAWISKFICGGTGSEGPKMNDCSYQCDEFYSFEGVVLQAQFRSYCFVVNVDLIEFVCTTTEYRYTTKYAEFYPYGDVYTYIYADISGYLDYTDVYIDANYITIPNQYIQFDNGYIDLPSLDLYVQSQTITVDDQYVSFSGNDVYINPFSVSTGGGYVTIPSQTIDLAEHGVNTTATGTISPVQGTVYSQTITQDDVYTEICDIDIPQLLLYTNPSSISIPSNTGQTEDIVVDITHTHDPHDHTVHVHGYTSTDEDTLYLTSDLTVNCNILGQQDAPVYGDVVCSDSNGNPCYCSCTLQNAYAEVDFSSAVNDCTNSTLDIFGSFYGHRHYFDGTFTTSQETLTFVGDSNAGQFNVTIPGQSATIPQLTGYTEATTIQSCKHLVHLPDIVIPETTAYIPSTNVTISDMYIDMPQTTVQTYSKEVPVGGATLTSNGQYVDITGDNLYIYSQTLSISGQYIHTDEARVQAYGTNLYIPSQQVYINNMHGHLDNANVEINHNITAESTFSPDQVSIEFHVKTTDTMRTYRYDLCVTIQQVFLESALGDIVSGCGDLSCPTSCNPVCTQDLSYSDCSDCQTYCYDYVYWTVDDDLLEITV